MGRRTERFRAHARESAAQGALAAERRRRERSELELRFLERFLGSDEQVEGFGLDPRLVPFSQRMEVEQEALAGLGGRTWGHDGISGRGLHTLEQGGSLGDFKKWIEQEQARQSAGPSQDRPSMLEGVSGYGNWAVGQINQGLAEAEEMARKAIETGDDALLAEAEARRQQAMNLVQDLNPTTLGPEGEIWTNAFNVTEAPEAIAKSKLDSPMAQIVGGLVKQGREFLDYDSTESQRFRRNLTAEADRRLSNQRRAERSNIRDLSAGLGAGRNPFLERALEARSNERIATEMANNASQAATFFQEYSRSFAANAATFGQAWIQNTSGIREEYQGALDSLAKTAAEFSNFAANRSLEFMRESASFSADDKNRTWQRIGDIGQLVMDTISAGASLFGSPGTGAAGALASGPATTSGISSTNLSGLLGGRSSSDPRF